MFEESQEEGANQNGATISSDNVNYSGKIDAPSTNERNNRSVQFNLPHIPPDGVNRKLANENKRKKTKTCVKQSDNYNHGRIQRVKTMDSVDDLLDSDCDDYETGRCFTFYRYSISTMNFTAIWIMWY